MAEPGREHKTAREAVTAAPHVPVVSVHITLKTMLEKTLPPSSRGRRGASPSSPGARCGCNRRRAPAVLMALSPATGVVTKVVPPSVVAWTLVMTTLDTRTLAAAATLSRTVTATPGGGPALARRSLPLTGSWYETEVVET